MATKPNVLCFNEYISDHLKNENDKRGKTPRTAEFAIFGAPPKKNRKSEGEGGRAVLCAHAFIRYFCGMNTSFEMRGIDALQWAREISKLPEGYFTLCFFPYSRSRGEAGASLVVKERCKWRTQLPDERFTVSAENYLLFSDSEGNPKMCYRILVRYMAFPNDGYKLHKINWL